MGYHPTDKAISDQVAADALRNGSKSGPVPTHSAMQNTDENNPEADATDAAQDDYFDNEEGN